MIRDALEKDKNDIYVLWQSSFSLRNGDALNSFFNYVMDRGNTVIQEVDERIVSTVHIQYFDLVFNGRILKASYLSHIATHPDYRRAGYMSQCMQSVLDECENKVLFTFIEASNPKMWERFGFQNAATHRYYELNASHFTAISSKGVSEDLTAEDLKHCYDEMMKHFDGYRIRDLHYFETMIKEAKQCKEHIYIARSSQGPQGYVRFQEQNGVVKVRELLYTGSNACCRLLKAALGKNHEILIEVSEAEHLKKIFNLAIPRKRTAIMVRCNNFPLFNKLFNTKAKTSKEAYAIGNKPKYMNERY